MRRDRHLSAEGSPQSLCLSEVHSSDVLVANGRTADRTFAVLLPLRRHNTQAGTCLAARGVAACEEHGVDCVLLADATHASFTQLFDLAAELITLTLQLRHLRDEVSALGFAQLHFGSELRLERLMIHGQTLMLPTQIRDLTFPLLNLLCALRIRQLMIVTRALQFCLR